MSSDDKKIWQKPELTAFNDAEEAIAYYTERGMHEHAAAIKRLAADAKQIRQEEERRLSAAARR